MFICINSTLSASKRFRQKTQSKADETCSRRGEGCRRARPAEPSLSVNQSTSSLAVTEAFGAKVLGVTRCRRKEETSASCSFYSHQDDDVIHIKPIFKWQQTSGRLFKLCSTGNKSKSILLHHYHHCEPLMQADLIHAFLLPAPNSDPTVQMLQKKSTLIRPGDALTGFENLCLSFTFVANSSATHCGLLLL